MPAPVERHEEPGGMRRFLRSCCCWPLRQIRAVFCCFRGASPTKLEDTVRMPSPPVDTSNGCAPKVEMTEQPCPSCPPQPVADPYEALERSAADRRKWIDGIQGKLFSWSFSPFELDEQTKLGRAERGCPLITMTLALLELFDVLDNWRVEGRKMVERKTVEKFLYRIEGEYLPNPYHNAIHAADVTQTAAIILHSMREQLEVTKMETFCVIVASAVHDLGHLGVNNDFLINSRHERATIYNDKSVNENYHISRAFQLARTCDGCDIFELFTFAEQKQCRKLMIDAVMATDMAIHFDLLRNFSNQLQAEPNLNGWQERNLLFQMVVHIADIANPSRPFPLARGWAERVIQEFCDQGDKELAQGLPISPFCVRETMNMPKAQLGFIDVFVKPTLAAFRGAAPQFADMALQSLEVTIQEWRKLESAGFKMAETPPAPTAAAAVAACET